MELAVWDMYRSEGNGSRGNGPATELKLRTFALMQSSGMRAIDPGHDPLFPIAMYSTCPASLLLCLAMISSRCERNVHYTANGLFPPILAACIPVLDRVLVPWIVVSSVLVSVYLIYVMVVILKDLCVVCMATHAVNAALLAVEVVACSCRTVQGGRDKKQD